MKDHVPDELVAAASGSAPTLYFYAIAIGVSIFFPVRPSRSTSRSRCG